MTSEIQTYKHVILAEATRIANEIRSRWPDVVTRPSLDTREGEDAYIWIYAPEELEEEIRTEVSGYTVDLYEHRGIQIMACIERPQARVE